MTEYNFAEEIGKIKNAFEKPEIIELKQSANSSIREAVLENNRLTAKIALVSYCLFKLCTKEHIVQNKNWQNVRKAILKDLESAMNAAKQDYFLEIEKKMDSIIKDVNEIDSELGFFLTGIFEKSKIKLASTAYVMGLSLGQAAELTGAEKKQLSQYIANTTISEEEIPSIGISDRLEKIKKILKEKK